LPRGFAVDRSLQLPRELVVPLGSDGLVEFPGLDARPDDLLADDHDAALPFVGADVAPATLGAEARFHERVSDRSASVDVAVDLIVREHLALARMALNREVRPVRPAARRRVEVDLDGAGRLGERVLHDTQVAAGIKQVLRGQDDLDELIGHVEGSVAQVGASLNKRTSLGDNLNIPSVDDNLQRQAAKWI